MGCLCRRTCACDAWVTMCVGFLNVISPIQSPQHGQPPHMALKTFGIASKPCPPDGDINLIDTQRQRKKEAKHNRNTKCTRFFFFLKKKEEPTGTYCWRCSECFFKYSIVVGGQFARLLAQRLPRVCPSCTCLFQPVHITSKQCPSCNRPLSP